MKNEIPKNLYGKELSQFLVSKLSTLADEIVQDKEQLDKFAEKWTNGLKFHNYSMNNCILALFQRPDSSLLAGKKKWSEMGRTVKKQDLKKPIRILAPIKVKMEDENSGKYYFALRGFRYVNVFDVKQTKGKKIDFGHSDKVVGEVRFEVMKKISPLPVKVEYEGLSNGSVTPKVIRVAPKENEASMVATLIHEIAHYELGHLTNNFSKKAKEIEAETVSYLVCSYLNLKNEKAKFYIGNWGGDAEELADRGKKILMVSEKIIRKINKEVLK